MVEPTSTRDDRRSQLRDFLRTRRERLTPQDVGIVDVGRRRTPGLRREEVASLAGVGLSWYTWLEQGRDIKVSPEVLDAVSRALRLAEPERTHLYLLAGLNPPPVATDRQTAIPPELRNLLDAWLPRPAILRDMYWNVLAVNDATRTVFGLGDDDRNCLVAFFTNERYRGVHASWATAAPAVVAAFRADAAHFPGDPEFGRITDDLRSRSPEFAAMWARHDVGVASQSVKAVRHPELGDLYFDTTTMRIVDQPQWFVEMYNPRP